MIKRIIAFVLFMPACSYNLRAADTLRVMAYNVLNYGDHCQAPNSVLHSYLKTIVSYTSPDILSLEKMASIQISPADFHGLSPIGFADSIVDNALDAAFPDRYAYAPFTNNAGGSDMAVLFYNKQKLGYLAMTTLVVNITDFNLYKLYYKDPALAVTHDTTFIYAVLNHTQSGNSSTVRDAQITAEAAALRAHFPYLPNMINMGDYNVHSSLEINYQQLTAPTDSTYRFYDPPFTLDHTFAYPANWDSNPVPYTQCLTTSTRASASIPNTCGTSGGAKSWYDHIFLSPWIAQNSNYISYIAGSYKAIGNDGNRLGISINDSSTITNTSAPKAVLDALFQLSNKYPVMVRLAVKSNTTGISPTDPTDGLLTTTGISNLTGIANKLSVANPAGDKLLIFAGSSLQQHPATVQWYDATGRLILAEQVMLSGSVTAVAAPQHTGLYFVRIITASGVVFTGMVERK